MSSLMATLTCDCGVSISLDLVLGAGNDFCLLDEPTDWRISVDSSSPAQTVIQCPTCKLGQPPCCRWLFVACSQASNCARR